MDAQMMKYALGARASRPPNAGKMPALPGLAL